MNRYTRLPALITSLCISTSIGAETIHDWHCTTTDKNNKQWFVKSIYERAARAQTMDACKKQSKVPASCKTDCEGFNHGISTRPAWQCTALDDDSKAWKSAAFAHRDDAAIAARENCKAHSSVPDSCYLNFSTCKNLNHWP